MFSRKHVGLIISSFVPDKVVYCYAVTPTSLFPVVTNSLQGPRQQLSEYGLEG